MSEWYAETDSDFNNYFDLKAHGVSAVFTNTGGTAKTIQIILNEEYIDVGDEVSIESNQPMAYCRSIDVLDAVFGNTLAVSAILDIEGNVISAAQNYNIVDVQPDGTGITILILQEN